MNTNTASFTVLPALVSVLTAHINTHGRVDDAIICKEVAAYLVSNKVSVHNGELFDFINEYGEPIDETYCGRDEEGEKIYQTFNPDTNWNGRIHKELTLLGFWTA